MRSDFLSAQIYCILPLLRFSEQWESELVATALGPQHFRILTLAVHMLFRHVEAMERAQ